MPDYRPPTPAEARAFESLYGCTPGEYADKMRRKARKRRKQSEQRPTIFDSTMIRFFLDMAAIHDRMAGRDDWAKCTCLGNATPCHGCVETGRKAAT